MNDLPGSLTWLDRHHNREATAGDYAGLSLDTMAALTDVLGRPQQAYPVVHISGTNGKGSTAAMVDALLRGHGLSVGRCASPHLEAVNERLNWDGAPIGDDDLAEILDRLAAVEDVLDDPPPSWFELVTAAAFLWWADLGIDVAVVEVGLLGRFDATNVAEADVAVVTNVGLDHTDGRDGWEREVAGEKAGIVTPGRPLVLGDVDPSLLDLFEAESPSEILRLDQEYGCVGNQLAIGGRLVDVRTPAGVLDELYLPVHGEHQGINLAEAVMAVETFFGRGLDPTVAAEALDGLVLPGRFEIVGRAPLVVIDGAHNPDGATAFARTLAEDLDVTGTTTLVVGLLEGRDAKAVLQALGASPDMPVVACAPDSPRAVPAARVAAAAEALDAPVAIADSVSGGLDLALAGAGPDDAVCVVGSLHVAGEARAACRASGLLEASPPP